MSAREDVDRVTIDELLQGGSYTPQGCMNTVYRLAVDGQELNAADFHKLAALADRATAPMLLWDAHDEGVISDAVVTALVGDAWAATEYPLDALDETQWRDLFDAAGWGLRNIGTKSGACTVRNYRR